MRKLPAAMLLVAVLLPVALAEAGDADESLARLVPADVGLFIEGRGVADLLLPLTEPQAWLTLAELAGQPAAVEETALWREQLRQAIRMEPAEAIDVLLSRQFAVVAEGLGRAQDTAVLCRPTVDRRILVERWRALPLPTAGRTSVYRLPNHIGLALPNDTVMFGDATLAGGTFGRLLDFADAAGGASLSADPIYRGLLARVPEQPDAVLFARLTHEPPASAPATRPAASELPGPLRGASNVLLALNRSNGMLHFSAVGDGPASHGSARTGLKPIVESLPEQTLLAWGLHLDYEMLRRAADRLPENSLLRIAFQMQQASGTIERLTGALDSVTCLAVGTVTPPSRTVSAPPIPAIAIMIAVEAAGVDDEMEAILESSRSICNLMALKTGSTITLPAIERIPLGHVEARLLDLSALLRGQPGGGHIAELHLCWAIDGDVLIVASHSDWLRQVVAARHGDAPTLSKLLDLSPRPVASNSETIIAVQTGPIADLGRLWLAHLEDAAPYVMNESWWRARQPGGGNARLGVQVTELPEQKRLRVTTVHRGSPADGVLKVGDEIVGASGVVFATSQPIREVRTAIDRRPHARWVELNVERDGAWLPRRVPLPFVDPVQMLRRAVAIGQITQRAIYHDDASDQAGPRGFLSVELRDASRGPLFDFKLTPPPASMPSTPNDANND